MKINGYIHTLQKGSFWLRLGKNLSKEMSTISSIIRPLFGLVFAIIFGTLLFILEFNLVRIILALVALPVSTFLLGKYFTLLPNEIVIGMTIISIVSLSASQKGDKLVSWFGEIIEAILGGFKKVPSEPTPLPQKIFRFVLLFAVVSFFILLLI